jgi:hypothetical protein
MTTQATLMTMIFDPVKGFSDALLRPRAWLPMLAVLGGAVVIYALYFQTVDFGWFVERTLNANPQLTDDQREVARRVIQPSTMMWSTLAVTVIVTPLLFAVFALYYLLVAQVLGHKVSFGKWYAFCIWTSVPRLVVYPLMVYQIASSKGQVALEDLSMVSLHYLLGHQGDPTAWTSLASAIDLTTFWSAAVSVVGFRVWTGESLRTSVVVNAIPYAVFYGLWALRIALAG